MDLFDYWFLKIDDYYKPGLNISYAGMDITPAINQCYKLGKMIQAWGILVGKKVFYCGKKNLIFIKDQNLKKKNFKNSKVDKIL